MPWTMSDVSSQKGRTFVVTGSDAGIGFATAQLLAGKGAKVVMACRNAEKGQQALARLQSAVPKADASLMLMDLASLASVRKFAETFKAQHDRLDVLINNAGLMMPPLSYTTDGFEIQFGTNLLGHFALTGLLLPVIEQTPQSRIVSLSSIAHWNGRIDFDNLNAQKGYARWRAYAQSKLGDLMFAYELNRRLQRAGSSTISLGVHPGGTQSDLSRNNIGLKLISMLGAPFLQLAESGAMPSIRAAVDADAKGGDYFGPGGLGTISGPPVKQRSSRRSHDEIVAARLWETCQRLTGVSYLPMSQP